MIYLPDPWEADRRSLLPKTKPWVIRLSWRMGRNGLFQWLRLATKWRARCVAIAVQAGVTLDDLAIMSCLIEGGPMNHGVLAKRVGIDRADLADCLRRLGNLVGSELIDRDGRCTEMSATHSTVAQVERVFSALSELEAKIMSVLSTEERAVWRSLMARLLVAHC